MFKAFKINDWYNIIYDIITKSDVQHVCTAIVHHGTIGWLTHSEHNIHARTYTYTYAHMDINRRCNIYVITTAYIFPNCLLKMLCACECGYGCVPVCMVSLPYPLNSQSFRLNIDSVKNKQPVSILKYILKSFSS